MTGRIETSVLVAAGACAVTLALFTWTVADAFTITPVRMANHQAPVAAAIRDPNQSADTVPMQVAVDADPFRMDRHRPPRRFLLPGTRVASRAVAASPTLALAGTAVYPGGGGVALVRVAGRAGTQMVRVGETLEGLTLRSVEPAQAVFAGANGTTVVLQVPKAGGS
jgi:hypothetical protein